MCDLAGFFDFLEEWWDVIAFVIYTPCVVAAWNEQQRRGLLKPTTDDDERRYGTQLMTTSSASCVTAVSILVPASLLVVQTGWANGAKFIDSAIPSHLFHASAWFLLSLFLGLFVFGTITFVSPGADARKLRKTGIPFALQIIALFLGMFQLVIALHEFLYGKGG